jgi:hypothetical protein
MILKSNPFKAVVISALALAGSSTQAFANPDACQILKATLTQHFEKKLSSSLQDAQGRALKLRKIVGREGCRELVNHPVADNPKTAALYSSFELAQMRRDHQTAIVRSAAQSSGVEVTEVFGQAGIDGAGVFSLEEDFHGAEGLASNKPYFFGASNFSEKGRSRFSEGLKQTLPGGLSEVGSLGGGHRAGEATLENVSSVVDVLTGKQVASFYHVSIPVLASRLPEEALTHESRQKVESKLSEFLPSAGLICSENSDGKGLSDCSIQVTFAGAAEMVDALFMPESCRDAKAKDKSVADQSISDQDEKAIVPSSTGSRSSSQSSASASSARSAR